MNWSQFQQRLGLGGEPGTAPFVLPPVMLELEPDFVLGARLAARGNGSAHPTWAIRRLALAGLRSRPLAPAVQHANIHCPAEVGRGLQAVAAAIGNGSSRFGLLVPDGLARVAILDFETLPDDRRETEALLRWRMKDLLPFPPEEVRLSYQITGRSAKRLEVVAVASRNSVMAEYEAALDELRGAPALILPATLALLPLVSSDGNEGQLVIHLYSGSLTLAVVEGERLRLWRSREVSGRDVQQLAEEVASEAARVTAAARDRLEVELRRAWVCSRPPAPPALAAALAAGLGHQVATLAPDPELAGALPAPERALLEGYGAPIAGLLANVAGGNAVHPAGNGTPGADR